MAWGHCGCTGVATSGEDGRYELNFGPGILIASQKGATLQAATISAIKPGYFEENLNRQGGCLAADSDARRRAAEAMGREQGPPVPARPSAGDQLQNAAGGTGLGKAGRRAGEAAGRVLGRPRRG